MSLCLSLVLDGEMEGTATGNDLHLCVVFLEELDALAESRGARSISALGATDDLDAMTEAESQGIAFHGAALGQATLRALLDGVRCGEIAEASEEEQQILADELHELSERLDLAAGAGVGFRFIIL